MLGFSHLLPHDPFQTHAHHGIEAQIGQAILRLQSATVAPRLAGRHIQLSLHRRSTKPHSPMRKGGVSLRTIKRLSLGYNKPPRADTPRPRHG